MPSVIICYTTLYCIYIDVFPSWAFETLVIDSGRVSLMLKLSVLFIAFGVGGPLRYTSAHQSLLKLVHCCIWTLVILSLLCTETYCKIFPHLDRHSVWVKNNNTQIPGTVSFFIIINKTTRQQSTASLQLCCICPVMWKHVIHKTGRITYCTVIRGDLSHGLR